jgi:hypothetical protein
MYLVAAMLAVVALTLWRMPSAPAANGTTTGIVRSGNLLIMEPDRWPGQSLPIMEYLLKDEGGRSERSADPGVPGMKDEKGRSLAIIYSNDCDHCRQAVPRFQASALRSSIPTLFIEMPPYASPGQELVRPSVSSGPITVARLTDQHEWFASTPIIIELNNGIIQRVAKGKAAENVDKWFGAVKDEPHTEATETTEKDPISLCPPCALCEASLSQLNVVRALQ